MSNAALASIALIAVIDGNVGSMTAAEIRAVARDATEPFAGVRALSEEELFVGGDDATRDTVLACGADVACLTSVLRSFDTRLGLIVAVLEVPNAPALIVLRLIDAKRAIAVATDGGAWSPAEGTLAAAIRARTTRLFERSGYRVLPVSVRIAPPAIEVLESSVSPWWWIALGGAVLAGGSIALFAATRSSPSCICFQTSDGACPGCD